MQSEQRQFVNKFNTTVLSVLLLRTSTIKIYYSQKSVNRNLDYAIHGGTDSKIQDCTIQNFRNMKHDLLRCETNEQYLEQATLNIAL